MNKFALQFVGATSIALGLSGCSLFLTDHSNDYQNEKPVTSTLETPAGSKQSKDLLVIPNEDKIGNLEPSDSFTTPRAPFVFYPMVNVGVTEQDDAIEFLVPADQQQAKRIVADFLTALHGAGTSIASQTDNQIISIAFDFHPQGWWASLWSDITRLHPAQTVFSFRFSESGDKTRVSVQFRDEQQDVEPSRWMSPVQNDDAYSVAVRLWGAMGRQLNQSSAYLSNRDDTSPLPVWVDHQGLYAIYLGKNVSPADIETKLNMAGMYLMPEVENMLAPVPPEEVARIGDVIDFMVPSGKGSEMKLFNTRRRNLDDVGWEEREYAYQITHQKAGDFLVIDVSSMALPEVVSFHLAQRFVN
ncbi:hypothetical protein HGG82_01465 [Marinomonas sp. M1K-6]|uniref:Uncharacterized protein n=1 Tax=Marinomonas profundi TaxID=2726122 RepID=A0A847R7P2_9GAMM|nr:hypothetical protein [Marinomonas profundi]NLQ16290.1 hypothetical protein [Marinomonas profundi]UDV03134.1 hypothetical protein J8N69_16530 [Marinomonas profundi]